ncbi:ABC transporter ATP-binding protein [Bosea beijingensis]|uniref:ABC transporter ATP-binding protein n=1 Tax=Bosea beijingensis TaxID=3068632 RepID=UPI00274161E8|nr:ABC transporter ATP-binding protein [Bosea sp. REN20]
MLDIEGLRISIQTHDGILRPVRHFDLTLERGETHAIVGESGCGKSMTALAIMRLLKPGIRVDAEKLELSGVSLLGLSPKRLRALRGERIAMIFQDPMTALDPCYRIGDQMTEVFRQHRAVGRREALDRAVDLLGKVGVPSPAERVRQFPQQLSGGLRQRVMIAMALLCEPELIIADEPTTALDVTTQGQILRLLKTIQQETGVGLILITHDVGVVSAMADRVTVMYGGEVVETGRCHEVLGSPSHPYTEGLLRSIPMLGQDREAPLGFIPGMVPRQKGELARCGFLERCPYANSECAAKPILLRSFAPRRKARCLRSEEIQASDGSVWLGQAEAAA